MSGGIAVWWAVFSAGILLALVGGRRPGLAERVRALRPEESSEKRPSERVFLFPFLETTRPWLEAVGEWIEAVGRRLGLDTEDLSRRLALAGRPEGASLFLGEKVFFLLLGLAAVPFLEGTGLLPLPGWVAMFSAAAGFFLPDVAVAEQGRRRRQRLEEGLVEANLAIALRVAGGVGVSEAVEEARHGEGPFAAELSRALSEARLAGRGPADALERLASRTGLEEAADLAGALRAAEQGAPLAETLLAQARAISERHRLESLAAGQRAEVRMLLVQAGLILPGFFLLVLYPVGRTLLRFAGG